MPDPKSVENDLNEYLNKEANLSRNDKAKYLKAIFDKHFSISQLEHSINYYDLQQMMSMAKLQWVKQKLPMIVSGKQIVSSDVNVVAILEAVLYYLGGQKLLRKNVKVEYTDK